jgi:hypothetical protein
MTETEMQATLVAVAAYAGRVLEETRHMRSPEADGRRMRHALRTIQAECARVHAALTTQETT